MSDTTDSREITAPRYRVFGQSTTCPDGFDRTLFYVWDSHEEVIWAADHERVVCEGYAAELNRGPRRRQAPPIPTKWKRGPGT